MSDEMRRQIEGLRNLYASRGAAVSRRALVARLDAILASYSPETGGEIVHWSHRRAANRVHDFPEGAQVTRVRSEITCAECRAWVSRVDLGLPVGAAP